MPPAVFSVGVNGFILGIMERIRYNDFRNADGKNPRKIGK